MELKQEVQNSFKFGKINSENERDFYRNDYEKFFSKYPKGQMCSFYLRGLCWLKKCQFAHGAKDIDFKMLRKIAKDKKAEDIRY